MKKGTKRSAPDGGTWGRWWWRQNAEQLRGDDAKRKREQRAQETPAEREARYAANRAYQKLRRESARPERERRRAEARARREAFVSSEAGRWALAMDRCVAQGAQRQWRAGLDPWERKLETLVASSKRRPRPGGVRVGIRKPKASWSEAMMALVSIGLSKLSAARCRRDPWVDCVIRKIECFKSRGRWLRSRLVV